MSSNFAHFAADTTPYECCKSSSEVAHNIEITKEKMFDWFGFNCLKANASQCYCVCLCNCHYCLLFVLLYSKFGQTDQSFLSTFLCLLS